MSATPMFNRATHIQWILNLLLKMTKRPTISNKVIFDERKPYIKRYAVITKKYGVMFRMFEDKNPVTFPIRLYPEGDPLCIKRHPNETSMEGTMYDYLSI